MSKRLPNIQDLAAGCFRLRETYTGQLFDVVAGALSATTTLANSLTDMTADAVVTNELQILIPDTVPVGDYELVIYDVAKASVTASTVPYRHVLCRVDDSGKAWLK